MHCLLDMKRNVSLLITWGERIYALIWPTFNTNAGIGVRLVCTTVQSCTFSFVTGWLKKKAGTYILFLFFYSFLQLAKHIQNKDKIERLKNTKAGAAWPQKITSFAKLVKQKFTITALLDHPTFLFTLAMYYRTLAKGACTLSNPATFVFVSKLIQPPLSLRC